MAPCRFEVQNNPGSIFKARDANVYLVKRGSVSEEDNWYTTSDFKLFNPISFVCPEKKFNWLTSELHTWISFKGRVLQGVLYKPENFDSERKYPVILHYYDKMSLNLNKYLLPRPMADELNIPWFVSKGYLVFTPDIFYEKGIPGQGIYDAVVSAAEYLKHFSWIDSTKMGIQGHSWGGYETNYIVTHTSLFAAAMASSGNSNLISYFGNLNTNTGKSLQVLVENGPFRIFTTPWDDPELYLKNSPVLYANKVTTPLLMMNNKEDAIIPFEQGLEFFTALRRLKKKVWMLQYDGEGHSILQQSKETLREHTIRVTQFFDHFLKETPAPKWIIEGIPAQEKGKIDGLNVEDEN
jgi:dipeptidyl aminopeptidase/acylaminoacyl peptidase